MPVNILRLNQRGRQHPNDRIVFIKALPGPTYDTAVDFLSRIAAQCVPLMKSHSLSIMTLEEHEPNREFVGRNFNAGEVIQLVLHPINESGRWLPFKYVQLVMMHELAHCNQMNHSQAFWAVRNMYANDMRELWAKGYTGEGLWGRGQALYNGQYTDNETLDSTDLPEHLCGGTYRSRGRKRKRGGAGHEQLSSAERKQKRIAKKFGTNGQDLGADDVVRRYLEKGKTNGAQPRVAKSKRGRELRAEAAALRLKRIQAQQRAEREAEEMIGKEDEMDSDQTEESEHGDEGDVAFVDDQGRRFMKTCEDQDDDDNATKDEMTELFGLGNAVRHTSLSANDVALRHCPTNSHEVGDEESRTLQQRSIRVTHPSWNKIQEEVKPASPRAAAAQTSATPQPHGTRSTDEVTRTPESADRSPQDDREAGSASGPNNNPVAPDAPLNAQPTATTRDSEPATHRAQTAPSDAPGAAPPPPLKLRPPAPVVCPICSLGNTPDALTCAACAHVLDVAKLTRTWTCAAAACRASMYVNSADAGRCGICGAAKPVGGG